MNVIIRDREPFQQLNAADVAAYLRSEGWAEIEHQPDRVSVWAAGVNGETLEVLLPLRRTLGDYVLRMAETVGAIAAKEKRSQLEVLADLQSAGSEIVRIRYWHAVATDGSIPLDQGEALVENAREMMLAGACAAVQPKAYYSRRPPEEANRFVRGLRMGQSERGSYILTIYSRVSPSLNPAQNGVYDDPDAPFERRAILQLASALASLWSATDQALTAPSAEEFQKAVN